MSEGAISLSWRSKRRKLQHGIAPIYIIQFQTVFVIVLDSCRKEFVVRLGMHDVSPHPRACLAWRFLRCLDCSTGCMSSSSSLGTTLKQHAKFHGKNPGLIFRLLQHLRICAKPAVLINLFPLSVHPLFAFIAV